jgi:SAM-dependent MidA family methyltransferase
LSGGIMGETDLNARIRAEIEANPQQRITFARFMERALTEPGLGYYATSDRRPTRDGDFLTGPELHPFFGRCVGRILDDAWRRLAAPGVLTVREWGAGRGTLATTVRDGLRADGSPLTDALDWEGVELGHGHGGPLRGVVIANEFLDALPAHRVVMRDGALRERFVTWDADRFVEVDGDPSTPALAEHLAADAVILAEGQLAEICLAAPLWVHRIGHDLEQGLVLIIDYGHRAAELYGPRRLAGTLVTYRNHQAGSDPFESVGSQDLTAHIDLTAIERAGEEVGLTLVGSTTQARFLADLGLGDLLSDLGRDRSTDPNAYLQARASVGRLLDPRHLGGFRVLAFARGVPIDPPLRGFRNAVG